MHLTKGKMTENNLNDDSSVQTVNFSPQQKEMSDK